MMIFAPNKKGAQGDEEEDAGCRRKAGSTGTSTPAANAPTAPTQSQDKTWTAV